ncbi:hypothetical protein [Flavobacterium sp.]|uniref:hypothetical protein n=1 Tax=Flavobacterium sp. TaxID=239 RepID=UPI0026221065|nr:hypothetical protein [Flavobacterium sp.]
MKNIFKIFIVVIGLTFLMSNNLYEEAAKNSSEKKRNGKQKSEQNSLLFNSIIGIYEYKTNVKNENHYIVLDSINGKLVGMYFGSENEGEHGIAFYENAMENLKIEKNKISFEILSRELFAKSQFKIVKNNSQKEKSIGLSKTKLEFIGKFTNSTIELKCESKNGDCWEPKIKFIKLNKKNVR